MGIMGTGSIFSQYNKIAGMVGQEKASSDPGFHEILSQTFKNAYQQVKSNEQLAKQHVVDQVDLAKLAPNTAELDVKITEITAFRDKILGAIQELLKMQA
ncbi:MAG: flagellar hook-basal body complex protein FliE [Candidatus Paracaedibacteraceae bacterium]|nr:flagellar hook-basal body complex protein FliE [Candidatus Paracaedibacteraceae bacterium]